MKAGSFRSQWEEALGKSDDDGLSPEEEKIVKKMRIPSALAEILHVAGATGGEYEDHTYETFAIEHLPEHQNDLTEFAGSVTVDMGKGKLIVGGDNRSVYLVKLKDFEKAAGPVYRQLHSDEEAGQPVLLDDDFGSLCIGLALATNMLLDEEKLTEESFDALVAALRTHGCTGALELMQELRSAVELGDDDSQETIDGVYVDDGSDDDDLDDDDDYDGDDDDDDDEDDEDEKEEDGDKGFGGDDDDDSGRKGDED